MYNNVKYFSLSLLTLSVKASALNEGAIFYLGLFKISIETRLGHLAGKSESV